MDPLAEYKKIAKAKYEKMKAEETAKKLKEEEEENARKLEEAKKELIKEDELQTIQIFLDEFETYITSLTTTNDVSLILQMISCQMESIIDLIKVHDKLKEIQEKIIHMVQVLNDIHKNKKHLAYVQEIDKLVKNIFKTAEINDIEVQLMDTEDDEEFAKKLQAELYNNHNDSENEI
jgi:hypothetical protein